MPNSATSAPLQPSHFIWRLSGARGAPLTGEKKADMADKMTEIMRRIGEEEGLLVDVSISYDENQVIAAIRPLPSERMRGAAAEKARVVAQTGVSGAFSRALLFLFRLGKAGADELTRRLAADYVQEDLIRARSLLQARLQDAISQTSPSRGSTSHIESSGR